MDTNIVSAFAPKRQGSDRPKPETAEWFNLSHKQFYISTVSVTEIESGVLKAARTAPGKWQRELSTWYDMLVTQLADRILAVDIEVARIAAGLTDRASARGLNPGFPDMAIAATSIAYKMVLLTRNLRHFAPLGIAAIDPFEALPP